MVAEADEITTKVMQYGSIDQSDIDNIQSHSNDTQESYQATENTDSNSTEFEGIRTEPQTQQDTIIKITCPHCGEVFEYGS